MLVFTYRRPEQIANAILCGVAILVDFLLVIILPSAATAATTLALIRAVAIDVKAQQPPSLGVLVVVRLSAVDELRGVVLGPPGKEGAVADGPEAAGGLGILVVKVVGLVLEARGGLVAEGDPILAGGGENFVPGYM